MQHMQVLQDNWLNATGTSRRAPRITPDLSEQNNRHRCLTMSDLPNQFPITGKLLEHATVSVSETKQSASRSRIAIFEVVARSCGSQCQCLCHKQTPFRSPAWLSSFLGSLFVSRNFLRACNSKGCQADMRRVAYTYAFPLWFLDRVLNASITTTTARGPELLIRLMRVRAPGSAIFTWSISGMLRDYATEMVEKMFNDGAASVLDITSNGLTALHVWKK